jgi:hypothetical protein
MKKMVGLLLFLLVYAPEAIPDTTEKQYAEYTFARVQFNMSPQGYRGRNQQGQLPWEHDYPKSEDFFLTMVSQVTGVHSSRDAYEVVQLESKDIFKYPFLYLSEPGYLELTDEEITNLRQYFNRGGFVMFDDFRGDDLQELAVQMKRVFPERDMFRLELNHQVFHSFYEIDSLEMPPPYRNFNSGDPSFWGMKDEEGRLILAANADNDFGEYWEDIDNGNEVLKPAVQSFRFGVNYLIYAMTH